MCTQKLLCALQSPLPRRCKSDSAPLAAAEHLSACFCVSRFQAFAHSGLGLLLLLERLLFCSFGGPAPSVVFLFLLVAVFGTGPLLLVTAVGVCLLMPRAFCMLGCFSFFWWLCLVVVFWRSGASARLGCSSSSLRPLGGCVGVCLVAFVFWRSGASAFSSSWWLRLPFVQ